MRFARNAALDRGRRSRKATVDPTLAALATFRATIPDHARHDVWLVNSGRTGDPLPDGTGAVRGAFSDWESRYGPVHGFDRAYLMRSGDVLVYRSVGTPVSRLVAVGTVLSPPQHKPFRQWSFQVRREITELVPTLREGPPFDLLDTPPVRMTKRLDDDTGRKAVELVASAARRSTT